MSIPAPAPVRPFSDPYLLSYSAEHVAYEFDMFLWLAAVCSDPSATLGAPTRPDATRIEAFAVHLRNVIDFLFIDDPEPSDVVAADFFDPKVWRGMRPKLSTTLKAARVRANKEIAHLTTRRITGTPPEKAWDFAGLAGELRPLMRLVVGNASATRLSPEVAAVIR